MVLKKNAVYIKGSILHRADFHAFILMIWDLTYKNSNLCETLGELISFCFSSLKEMGICRKLWKCIGSDDSLTRSVRCRITWSLLKISARELYFLKCQHLENGMLFHLKANNIFFQFSYCTRKRIKEYAFWLCHIWQFRGQAQVVWPNFTRDYSF